MNGPVTAGVAVIDKPAGWTSHQVVGHCRRIFGTRRVGHAGTLDPMATGVLLIGVNRATRLLGHLMLTEKEYAATIRLGISTTTDDAEGEIASALGCPLIDATTLRAALQPLTGAILQVPATVSAIKVEGRRAYARVRAGEQVTLAARPVTVHEFRLLGSAPAYAEGVGVLDLAVRVRCSSGTYIRALARDLGAALGCGGHLTALRRTRVGSFGLERAHPVTAETTELPLIGLDQVAAECFPTHELDATAAAAVGHGRFLPGLELTGLTALMHDGRFLALYRPAAGGARAEAVFA